MDSTQPPVIYRTVIPPEWIDRNHHFNAGFYMVAFDTALTDWFDYCGLGDESRRRHGIATFTVEAHATYERELAEGAPIEITAQLIAFSDKKIHTFLRMHHADEGYLAATNELLSVHMDMTRRRVTPMADEVLRRLQEIVEAQSHLPRPSRCGRVIDVAAKPPGR